MVSKSETSSIMAARLGIAAVVAAHTVPVVAFHVISANNASSWCTRQRAGARCGNGIRSACLPLRGQR